MSESSESSEFSESSKSSESSDGQKFCWVTLVTKPTYLPGAIILAHSLRKVRSQYPLIVMYTHEIGMDAIYTLNLESKENTPLIPHHVLRLLPPKGQENTGSVAERFADTFTKLRAFESTGIMRYTRACFLDADMAVLRNPDDIFRTRLPDDSWIAANHACVCNLDTDEWAAKTWTKGNCGYTPLIHPAQVTAPITPASRPTWKLLNGGMFLFSPSRGLWEKLVNAFNTSTKLKDYQFPDQEFLADFFRMKWTPVSWKYNALKTMRYLHPRLWSDDEVAIVHYIVDKPWERPLGDNGRAGHLGRDKVTHTWWWDLYNEWLNLGAKDRPRLHIREFVAGFIATQPAITTRVRLPQAPGEPSDVLPFVETPAVTVPAEITKPDSKLKKFIAPFKRMYRADVVVPRRAMSE